MSKLWNNRWLYIGIVYDDWGTSFQLQISLWRRDD